MELVKRNEANNKKKSFILIKGEGTFTKTDKAKNKTQENSIHFLRLLKRRHLHANIGYLLTIKESCQEVKISWE